MMRLMDIVLAYVAMITMTLLWSTMVAAHDPDGTVDWYESTCCDESHCRPIAEDAIRYLPRTVEVAGKWTLDYSDPRLRRSRDHRDHVCSDGAILYCVYQRPAVQ